MEDIETLRKNLISYIKRKFYTRRNIIDTADEVVNQAFLDVAKSSGFSVDQYNFGYMSTACLRAAYKIFHRNDLDLDIGMVRFDLTAPLIDEDGFVEEIEKAGDTAFILRSLQTLKQIEQVIINERYYGDFSFREISENHGINLNTVLSHHRRALEKLRPVFSKHFNYNVSDYYYGKTKHGGNNND
ncbi:MAG: sigma-70 family RNA polymerase sigma factor [Treponema sp.]|nr:sigma-70 family RNA polymerase sigma factor [Treponema sp.]